GRLIAPGSVERVFTDRQEFDMREPHVARVSWQFLRQLAVAQPTAAMVRMPPPGAEMDFIDRYRRPQCVDAGGRGARLLDRVAIDPDRRRLRSPRGGGGPGVGLQMPQGTLGAAQLIFFFFAGPGIRAKKFPKAPAPPTTE